VGGFAHVIWDWNGTLLDDAWLCLEVINRQLAQRHLPIVTYAEYQEAFCFPIREYYDRLGFEFGDEIFEDVAQEFIDDYELHRDECRLRPQVLEILDRVDAAGCGQSILSMYRQDALRTVTRTFGIATHMQHIIGLDTHYAVSKLDIGRRLIEQIDCPLDRIALIGDTDHDSEVATALGISCALVPGGHQASHRLAECNATLLDSLEEVVQWLALGDD
jgi:phosphoglycolate phosphatase